MDKKQVGWLVAVAVLSIVVDRTLVYWWGEDLPVPDNMGTISQGLPALRHNVQSGDYTIEEKARSTVIDFTNPQGASALLKTFKKGYFVDVAAKGGPVLIAAESGWLIGGHPTLEVPPGYRCTLLSEGDGFEILMMSNKP